jgi:hypothetical protein
MRLFASLLGIASVLGSLAVADPQSLPLRVSMVVTPGPYYVGQAIEIKVEVEGVSGQPVFEPPRSIASSIRLLPTDPNRPSLGRFLIVPDHPGSLELAPFRARSGDRSGASRPTRLTIANVPIEGRTPAFLGGVGSFQVRAEVEPSTLRTGQTLEYRIKLTGPAAWGSVRSPDLSEWTSLKPGFRVSPMPDVLEEVDPPIRTFRYVLRPSKAGKAVLPPVAVAAFDPKTGLYATRVTSGLPIQVEEPPRFDASRLDYATIGIRAGERRLGFIAVGLGLGLAALATVGLTLFAKRARKSVRADPRRLALELTRGLVDNRDEIEAARSVAGALTTFLERVGGRAPGVLTPPEASEGIERVTDDRDLARLAKELVTRCDQARFGRSGGDASGLIDEGRGLFEGIAEVMGKKRGKGGPREAVETAGK